MRELILELASLLPFSSGHAGLAFSSTHFSTPSFGQIREEAFRHPGIDVTHGSTSLGRRIDGVHWINLLGQFLLGEVGGIGGLQDRLHSPDTHVQEMEGGRAVVTLGQWPKGLSTCPEGYALVGASPSETQSWWRRFLDS